MATTREAQAPTKQKLQARIAPAADPERSQAMAELALRPSVNAAAVVTAFAGPTGIETDDLAALVDCLAGDAVALQAGDMKRAEAMLFGQAHALQAIFTDFARRAAGQQYLKNSEAFLRMALKAQNQCRMTLETLATIKNPPVVFARQANINNGGQQQVNNGAALAHSDQRPAHAANEQTAQSELLEGHHGQRLDTRAAGAASGADPQMAAVGAIHRATKR